MYEIIGTEENTADSLIGTMDIEDFEIVGLICELIEKERGGKVRYVYKEKVRQNFKEDLELLNDVCNTMRSLEREVNEWDYSYRMGATLTNCSNLINNATSQCITMYEILKLRLKQKAAPVQQPTNA